MVFARSVRVGSLSRRLHGEDSMKKSRFTEEQAAYALRQTEAGAPVLVMNSIDRQCMRIGR